MRSNLHRMLYAFGCQTQSTATILLRRAAAAVAQKMVTINIASKTVVTLARTKKTTNQSTIDGDDNSNRERSGLGSKSPGSKLI